MQIHSVVLFSVFFDYPLRTQGKKGKKKNKKNLYKRGLNKHRYVNGNLLDENIY